MPNYNKMPLSSGVITKLNLDHELKKADLQENIFYGDNAKKFAKELQAREAAKPKFQYDII